MSNDQKSILTAEMMPESSDEHAIAQSVLPSNYDDNKSRYLAYRACGFKPREAAKMTGVTQSSICVWRDTDPDFVAMEIDLPNIRHQLAEEFVNLEFLRNYTLVLKKDYLVLKQSIDPDRDSDGKVIPLSTQDHQYLLRARSNYNPQQLEILKAIASNKGKNAIDFTKMVIEAAKGADSVRLEVSRGGNHGSTSDSSSTTG